MNAEQGLGRSEGAVHVLGHVSITTTFDRYGHLFPGPENDAAALLDADPEGE